MQNQLHDVVVVGAGPVGLAVARMLGLRGHDVVIPGTLVRALWASPGRGLRRRDRAGFQSMGLSDEVKAISEPIHDSYEWRNAQGQTLVKIPWEHDRPSGWGMSFYSQPDLERVLADAVTAMPNVRLLRGAEVVQIHEDDDGVLLTYTSVMSKQRQIWRVRGGMRRREQLRAPTHGRLHDRPGILLRLVGRGHHPPRRQRLGATGLGPRRPGAAELAVV